MKALRSLLILMVLAAPVLFWAIIWHPAQVRMATNEARIREARARIQELPRYAPLSDQETAFLEAPSAPWKARLPLIRGDRDRLAHYHQVVTEVDQAFRRRALKVHGMRSSWNAIHASFTLDQGLGLDGPNGLPVGLAQEGSLAAWVLEVQLDGPTADLFTALGQLGAMPPLLEPVGFRWEATPERRAQALWLRNLVLVPPEGSR